MGWWALAVVHTCLGKHLHAHCSCRSHTSTRVPELESHCASKACKAAFPSLLCVIIPSKLLCCCRHGDIEAVEDFIAIGRDINEKDKDGRTPLHYAGELFQTFVQDVCLIGSSIFPSLSQLHSIGAVCCQLVKLCLPASPALRPMLHFREHPFLCTMLVNMAC